MVRKPNKTMIGLFLMIGGAVFALILGTYLKRVFWADNSNVVVMYFQESIKRAECRFCGCFSRRGSRQSQQNRLSG